MRVISSLTANHILFAKGKMFPAHTSTLVINKHLTFYSVGKPIKNQILVMDTAMTFTTLPAHIRFS